MTNFGSVDNNDKAVVFLDLLGFKHAANTDLPAAINLLQDYSDSLHMKLRDFQDADKGATVPPEVARLNHLASVSSFDTFLPMSDSIFIASEHPSDLTMQLSDFLWDCLQFRWHAFAHPENPAAPAVVTTKMIDLGASRTIEQKETWLPVLFRGGIAWGRARTLKAYGLAQGERIVGRNLVGEAAVSAVGLENRKPKGPRVLLSDAFVGRVEGDARAYVGYAPDVPGYRELLWPMAAMETAISLQDALANELGEMVRGIAHLLASHLADSHLAAHYMAFLGLTVRSALAKYHNVLEDLKKEVEKILRTCIDSPEVDGIIAQAFRGTQ